MEAKNPIKNPKIYFENEYFRIRKIPRNWVFEIKKNVKAFKGHRSNSPFISKIDGRFVAQPKPTFISKQQRYGFINSDKPLKETIEIAESYLKEYFLPS